MGYDLEWSWKSVSGVSSAIASALQTLCLEDRSQNTADELSCRNLPRHLGKTSVFVCVWMCACVEPGLKFISLPYYSEDYVFLKLGMTARMIFFSLLLRSGMPGSFSFIGSSRKHPYRFSTLFKETLTCAIAKIVKSWNLKPKWNGPPHPTGLTTCQAAEFFFPLNYFCSLMSDSFTE